MDPSDGHHPDDPPKMTVTPFCDPVFSFMPAGPAFPQRLLFISYYIFWKSFQKGVADKAGGWFAQSFRVFFQIISNNVK